MPEEQIGLKIIVTVDTDREPAVLGLRMQAALQAAFRDFQGQLRAAVPGVAGTYQVVAV